ncbi:ATP-binding protein [Thalassobacillus hwangdonensis]|uniref:AAA family ATPase n=1 Tax=Thalassobacillus hwangdonensis TaxID=546108 RepID=A0ABW3KV65_9BACI
MKISKLHIYGFGKWQDYTCTLDSSSFVSLVGNNEAGKSTIRQFILFVLFGMPPRKREAYQPKSGGTIGGKLELVSDRGKVTIERIHDKQNGAAICHLEDGSTKGEEFLTELLGGMNKEVFQSIYSFQAEDLTALHHLTAEEIGNTLLSIGLSGSSLIHDTEKSLKQDLEAVFKPHGKRPELNVAFNELDQLSKELKELEKEEASYSSLVGHLQQMEEATSHASDSLTHTREAYYQLKRVLQAEDLIKEFHKHGVESNEQVEQFPVNGRERLQALKDQSLPIRSEYNVHTKSIQEKETELLELENSLPSAEWNDTFQQWLNDLDPFRRDLDKEVEWKRSLEQEKDALEKELASLKLDMTMDDLPTYEFPFYLEERWTQLNKERSRLMMEAEHLESSKIQLTQTLDQLDNAKKKLEERQMSEDEYRTSSHLLDEHERQQRSQVRRKDADKARTWMYALILSLIGAAAAWLLTSPPLGVFALLLGAWSGWNYFREKGTETEVESGPSTKLSATEYDHLQQKLKAHEDALLEMRSLRTRLEEKEEETIRIDQQKVTLETRISGLQSQVSKEVAQYPFLEGIDPDYWIKILQVLLPLKRDWEKHEAWKEQFESLQIRNKERSNQLFEFFNHSGWEWEEYIVSKNLAYLETVQSELEQKHHRIASLRDSLEHSKEQAAYLSQKLHPYQSEVEALFHQAGVEGEEDFLNKAEMVEQIRFHQTEQTQLRRQLKGTLSEEELTSFNLLDQLPDFDRISFQINNTKERMNELEAAIAERKEQIASLKHQISLLEKNGVFSEVRHQYQQKRDLFQQSARKWAVKQVAAELLKQTKDVYQHQYLPEVTRSATDYFKRLTGGKYIQVAFHPEHEKLVVEDAVGFRYLSTELSRGTSDQLYVALRLSISTIISETNPLPFLIDDAFVHFDEGRREVMEAILEELAGTHQVILFTCRKDRVKEGQHAILLDQETKVAN